jgi:hypothetical protein
MAKETHGTTFTLGQFAELDACITRALPKALSNVDPKLLLPAVQQRGEALEQTLASALQTFIRNQQVAVKAPTADPAMNTYSVVVDYSRTLQEMVKAGEYYWVNDDITEKNFPRSEKVGEEQVVIKLMEFYPSMTSDEVINRMKPYKMDAYVLRPATIEECLAFWKQYPEIKRKHPIVALGSVTAVGDDRRVLYIGGDCDKYSLNLHRWDDGWYGDFRFAVVCQ